MDPVNTLPMDQLLPHRWPMILIDQMLTATPAETVCLVTIRPDSPFLEAEGVPAYVGIEMMAQAIAAHGGYLSKTKGEAVKTGFLLGTPKFKTHTPWFPLGQTLRIEVKEDWGDDQLMRFTCRILDHGDKRLLQEAGLNVFQPRNLDTYLQENRGGNGADGGGATGDEGT